MSAISPSEKLVLLAPLSGCLVPLERVPDPVFAQKMVGDGVSIDPTSSSLLAPCAGRITTVHACGHAITLVTASGLEIMMHVGLDTVHLKGEGFRGRVQPGDLVTPGQTLLEFDADLVGTKARSLLTQILATGSERVAAIRAATGSVTAGRDPILEIQVRAAPTVTVGEPAGGTVVSEAVVIPNPTGLHARPAAMLVALARRFQADVRLRRGNDQANAKSVVSIMGLDVRCGDKIQLFVQGHDAEAAIAAILPRLREGLGEGPGSPSQASSPGAASVPKKPTPPAAPAAGGSPPAQSPGLGAGPRPPGEETGPKHLPGRSPWEGDPEVMAGVRASPGLAVGKTCRVRPAGLAFEEQGRSPDEERKRLASALDQARRDLGSLHDRLQASTDAARAAIFAAHQELLEDPDLLEIASSAIAKGKSAPFAWQKACTLHADRLAGMANELLAARAHDLRDVGRRVLVLLTGAVEPIPEFPPDSILIAEDLSPSDTASLDRTRVVGFCTVGGGATSHAAILARSLGIPAIAGIDPRVLDLPDGTPAILDGLAGFLRLRPSTADLTEFTARQTALAARQSQDLRKADEPAITLDGHRVTVVANIGNLPDAQESVRQGGEGVGLLRSEFLFFDRTSPPSEEEQVETYRSIAAALGPDRPLVIRTLDVGGDKPLAYLPIPPETNPFLGVRGLRVALDHPDLLRIQVRAILRASVGNRLQVMFPMVTSLSEWRTAKTLLTAEAAALGVPTIPAGIMVEVPAAALLAGVFAAETEFLSLGTNDLTQYTLAMDRGHPRLAAQVDGLHPAVLHLIARTTEAGRTHQRPVSVCGGLAGDPLAVPILIGLGVDKLSVSVPAIPGIKAQIRRLSLSDCRRLATQALGLADAAGVRELVAGSTPA